jgi:uncharacterized integral membrane protein
MKTGTIVKLIGVGIMILYFLLFMILNNEPYDVHLIFTKARMPMYLVMIISALGGIACFLLIKLLYPLLTDKEGKKEKVVYKEVIREVPTTAKPPEPETLDEGSEEAAD